MVKVGDLNEKVLEEFKRILYTLQREGEVIRKFEEKQLPHDGVLWTGKRCAIVVINGRPQVQVFPVEYSRIPLQAGDDQFAEEHAKAQLLIGELDEFEKTVDEKLRSTDINVIKELAEKIKKISDEEVFEREIEATLEAEMEVGAWDF